jgi:hypothetical protein
VLIWRIFLLLPTTLAGRFVCAARLKIFAARIPIVQMQESGVKVIYGGMDGVATIRDKFDAFVV